jgi:hypothetical protein
MSVFVLLSKNVVAFLWDNKVLDVFVPVAVGAFVYFASCIILRVNELTDILSALKNKAKGEKSIE